MIDRIKSKILARIDEEWSQKISPVLLSKLGGALTYEEREYINQNFGGLAQFIRQELSDNVTLFKLQKKGLCAVSRENELHVNFQSEEAISDIGPSRKKSYESMVWKAFLSPIQADLKRFIDLSSTPKRIYDAETAESTDDIPVEPRDIPPSVASGGRAEPAEIRSAIEAWSKQIQDKNAIVRSFTRGEQRSLAERSDKLVSIVLSLDERDLRRISIPADIVKKLIFGAERGF